MLLELLQISWHVGDVSLEYVGRKMRKRNPEFPLLGSHKRKEDEGDVLKENIEFLTN